MMRAEQGPRRLFSRNSRSKHSDLSNLRGFKSDSDVSQVSTYGSSTFSGNFDRSTTSNSGSGRPLTVEEDDVGGVCITCFGPRRRKDAHNNTTIAATTSSSSIPEDNSFSRESTLSSSSHSNFRYSASINGRNAGNEVNRFSMAEIYKATGNFSTSNIIGEGHFGIIYKGKLKDGSIVAVKRGNKNISDKRRSNEFKNEIQALSQIEHLNLVRYFGYLEQDGERIIIFEYVGNGNLREHLDGSHGELEMAARLEIAIDIAHALTYLHTYTDRPIIHRDIKASNILITEKLRAKVADFGYAHLAPEDPDVTHISTQVKGTAGYLDPEYIKTYQLTEKSDVYSFGVLLVELVTGRRPIEQNRDFKERTTTKWAMQKLKAGDAVIAMDTRLRRNPASVRAAEKLLGLAYRCLAPSRQSRPTMKKCTEILWGIRKEFRELRDHASAAAVAASTDATSASTRRSRDSRSRGKERAATSDPFY